MRDRRIRKGILSWLLNDAPNAVKLTMLPNHVDDLENRILAFLRASGYRIVPEEATNAMAEVGVEARWRSCVRDADCVREIYRAMLAAAKEENG